MQLDPHGRDPRLTSWNLLECTGHVHVHTRGSEQLRLGVDHGMKALLGLPVSLSLTQHVNTKLEKKKKEGKISLDSGKRLDLLPTPPIPPCPPPVRLPSCLYQAV